MGMQLAAMGAIGAPSPSRASLPPVADQGGTNPRRRGRVHVGGKGSVRLLVTVLGFICCGLNYVVYHMHTLVTNGRHRGVGSSAEFADFYDVPAGAVDDFESFETAAAAEEEDAATRAAKLGRFMTRRHFDTNHTTLFPPYVFRTTSNLDEVGWDASRRIRDCEMLNPTYEHVVFDDAAMRDFVRADYPEFSETFDKLPEPVMRADMWRYLILHRVGGVYMDMDVECRRPIDAWCDAFVETNSSSPSRGSSSCVNALIGIEFCEGTFGYVQFVQWAMASRRPGHPIFYRTVEMIRDIVANSTLDHGDRPEINAEFVTGPVVFTAAVLEFLVRCGFLPPDRVVVGGGRDDVGRRNHLDNSTGLLRDCDADVLLGDLGILGKQAFGYHFMHPGSPPVDSPKIYLRHWFDGSWRPKPNLTSLGESEDW